MEKFETNDHLNVMGSSSDYAKFFEVDKGIVSYDTIARQNPCSTRTMS